MLPATAPYILRSIYKDEHILDSYVTRPFFDLVTAVFGAHFTNRYDLQLRNLSRGLYVALSLFLGQTLGEEFCELLPVVRGRPARLLGVMRKLLLALFVMLEPVAVFHFAVKFFPSVPPHDVIANVKKGTQMLLYLFETYGTIPHRLLGVQYLSLVPRHKLHSDGGAPRTYFVLGVVVMLELIVRFWRHLKGRRIARQWSLRSGAVERESEQRSEDGDTDKGHGHVTGKCTLCLGRRKQPTATLCGHIFCWLCLMELFKSSSRGAICPLCRRQITLQSAVPLYHYVAEKTPTVSSAQ